MKLKEVVDDDGDIKISKHTVVPQACAGNVDRLVSPMHVG